MIHCAVRSGRCNNMLMHQALTTWNFNCGHCGIYTHHLTPKSIYIDRCVVYDVTTVTCTDAKQRMHGKLSADLPIACCSKIAMVSTGHCEKSCTPEAASLHLIIILQKYKLHKLKILQADVARAVTSL